MVYDGAEWSIYDDTEGSFISVNGGDGEIVSNIGVFNHFDTNSNFIQTYDGMRTVCIGKLSFVFSLFVILVQS